MQGFVSLSEYYILVALKISFTPAEVSEYVMNPKLINGFGMKVFCARV